MVAADVPQIEQTRLLGVSSPEHPGHFGISHQYAQKPVTASSFPEFTAGRNWGMRKLPLAFLVYCAYGSQTFSCGFGWRTRRRTTSEVQPQRHGSRRL